MKKLFLCLMIALSSLVFADEDTDKIIASTEKRIEDFINSNKGKYIKVNVIDYDYVTYILRKENIVAYCAFVQPYSTNVGLTIALIDGLKIEIYNICDCIIFDDDNFNLNIKHER